MWVCLHSKDTMPTPIDLRCHGTVVVPAEVVATPFDIDQESECSYSTDPDRLLLYGHHEVEKSARSRRFPH
jgi:hypothetical protein